MEAQGLATGSADGKVQLWTSSLEMAVCIDIKALGPICHMVHSLSWDIINHKVRLETHQKRALLHLDFGLSGRRLLKHYSEIGECARFC